MSVGANAWPWAGMVKILARHSLNDEDRGCRVLEHLAVEAARTKTGAMRAALSRGPCMARELARAAGVESSLVGALLKGDLKSGRVTLHGGLYRLEPEFDASLRKQIAQAKRLLEANGYTVKGRK
jgi:hypothetical protein